MKNKIIDQTKKNIEEMDSFKVLIKNIFSFTREHSSSIFKSLLLTLIFFGHISIKIGFSNETIESFSKILDLSYDLSINIFGIIFTAYGLYQALSSKYFTIRLMDTASNKNENRSLFEDYNIFFIKTCIYYLSMVGINYILKVIIHNIDYSWQFIYFQNKSNNIIATTLIFFYLLLNVYGMFLVKSVLFNIYQSFNLRAYSMCEK